MTLCSKSRLLAFEEPMAVQLPLLPHSPIVGMVQVTAPHPIRVSISHAHPLISKEQQGSLPSLSPCLSAHPQSLLQLGLFKMIQKRRHRQTSTAFQCHYIHFPSTVPLCPKGVGRKRERAGTGTSQRPET